MGFRRLLSYDPPAPVEPSNEERILDAALTSFANHGIAATSLRTVAEAAGFSVGPVQHYYGTKGALIAAVDQYVLRTISDAMESEPLPAPPGDSLNEAGNCIIALYAEHSEVMDYAGRSLVEGGAVATKIFDGLLGISASQRDQFAEQELVRPDLDPVWAATNPLILRMGAVVFRATSKDTYPNRSSPARSCSVGTPLPANSYAEDKCANRRNVGARRQDSAADSRQTNA
jgi:AcrR family transcriptional regulator